MSTDSTNRASNSPQSEAVSDVYDKQEAIQKLGSETLLQKVAFLFLSNAPGHMESIKQAIDDGDSEALRRSAHTFASSMAYFCAPAATKSARALEEFGDKEKLGEAEQGYSVLKEEVDKLKDVLSQLLPEEGRPRES